MAGWQEVVGLLLRLTPAEGDAGRFKAFNVLRLSLLPCFCRWRLLGALES